MKKFLILFTLALMSLCAFAQSIPVPGGGRAQRAASGTPTDGQVPTWNAANARFQFSTPSGSGDFVGPSSSTNNNLIRFSGTTGKLGKDSSVIVDDSGNISTPGTATFGASGVGSIDIGVAGVRASGDGSGTITFKSLGAGSAEDFKFDLDSTANTVKVSSSTGVTLFDFASGSIGIKVPAVAYSSSYNGDTRAVTQDALYDQLHLSDTDDDGLVDKLDQAAAGIVNVNSSGVLQTPYTTSGSGTVVPLLTSPVFITPKLGVATAGSMLVTNAIVTPTATISASAIDLATGTLFTKSLSADTTFTFSNPTEGQGFTVVVTNSSTYTVTWPTVEWKGGNTPAQSATQTDVYSFLYANGKYLGVQTPGSPPGVEQEAYSAGTVYSLTATAALLDFGTTDPTVTVSAAGTYMIYWGGNYKYNGATFAANQTANMKVRRTNNTAADISNATLTATTRVITTVTDDLAVLAGKPVKYTAAAGDILQVWGSLSATPAAGSVDCTDAWIIIIRIQ